MSTFVGIPRIPTAAPETEMDPQDARGVVLSFTPEGEALCQRLMAVVEQRNQHIVACLTAGEQAQFDSLLTRLVEHARQTLHPPPER